MARPCSVCTNPARDAIEQDILDLRSSNRAIARRFSLSRWSVDRHARNHLGPLIAAHRDRYEHKVRSGLDRAAEKVGRFANEHVDHLLAIGLPADPQRRWSGKAMRARQRLIDIGFGMPSAGGRRRARCGSCGAALP